MGNFDISNSFENLLKVNRDGATGRFVKKASVTAIESLTEDKHESFSEKYDGLAISESITLPTTIEEHELQLALRPFLDKDGLNTHPIGTHPDFVDLEGTRGTRKQHITSIFFDIKNSTRLCLLYDIEEVYWIKNTILRASSEIVRSFDGYVHRFMGDALLAYFGSKESRPEEAAQSALNCAAFLGMYMRAAIVPYLKKLGFDDTDFGFRIGIDHGKDEDVIWASYGFNEVKEVTATSFYVDAASKLQSHATSNGAIIGQTIRDLIDLPNDLLETKKVIENGFNKEIPFLLPNLTYADGQSINYRMWTLDLYMLSKWLPIPLEWRCKIINDNSLINSSLFNFKASTVIEGKKSLYKSISRPLEKNIDLVFDLEMLLGTGLSYPLELIITKKNYGRQAEDRDQDKLEVKSKETIHPAMSTGYGKHIITSTKVITIKESTAYKGIHTMTAEIKDSRKSVLFRDIIAVHIL